MSLYISIISIIMVILLGFWVDGVVKELRGEIRKVALTGADNIDQIMDIIKKHRHN